MNIEEKFMREALKQAKKAASMGEMPVGAVIVHNGKIIDMAMWTHDDKTLWNELNIALKFF